MSLIRSVAGLLTAELIGGYGLSAGEKWANLYGACRWPSQNIKVIDYSVNPEGEMFIFSTGTGQATDGP